MHSIHASTPDVSPVSQQSNDVIERAMRYVRQQATEDDVVWLQAHPEEWYDALISVKGDIDAQMTERAAALLQHEQQCRRYGPEGKQAYFDYKAEYEGWRGKANRFKRQIELTLREVKRLRQDQRDAKFNQAGRNGPRMADLEARLAFLEREVSELRAAVSKAHS